LGYLIGICGSAFALTLQDVMDNSEIERFLDSLPGPMGRIVKFGLKNIFRDKPIEGNITFCFGSIDIRHHLLRHDNVDLKAMIKEYIKQAKECTDNPKFAAPVPVEYEGRKLPKTGYYKGTPFYGSQSERKRITTEFIDILTEESNNNVVKPPSFWYDMDPEKYALNFMERNSSVHIAPPFYRRNDFGVNAWDL